MADDGFRDAAWAVVAGCAHCRNAIDEFDFADRRHFGRPGLAIHRLTLEEHGRHNVVATADIGQQVGQEVAATMGCIPEVVMRIDDRQFRFKHGFRRPLGQPCLQLGVVAMDQAPIFSLGIAWLRHLHLPDASSLHSVARSARTAKPMTRGFLGLLLAISHCAG